MEKLYRYTKVCYDECLLDIENNSNVKIILHEFVVIKCTPSGYWILSNNKKKWVSSTGKKRFAYSEKSEALNNFKTRTNRSIWIMKRNIEFATLALKEAEKLDLNNENK